MRLQARKVETLDTGRDGQQLAVEHCRVPDQLSTGNSASVVITIAVSARGLTESARVQMCTRVADRSSSFARAKQYENLAVVAVERDVILIRPLSELCQ